MFLGIDESQICDAAKKKKKEEDQIKWNYGLCKKYVKSRKDQVFPQFKIFVFPTYG